MNDEFDSNAELRKLEEVIERTAKEQPFQERSEMGEIFDNLDSDKTNKEGLSDIDFNARMSKGELNACLIFDELQGLGIFDRLKRITQRAKRTSVSRDGKGRQEKTMIASGAQQANLAGRSGGFLARMFQRKE